MIHQTILLHASCLHAWSAQEFAIALTKNAAIGASWVYGVKKHIIIFLIVFETAIGKIKSLPRTMIRTLCFRMKNSGSPFLFLHICDASKETCLYASLSRGKINQRSRFVYIYNYFSILMDSNTYHHSFDVYYKEKSGQQLHVSDQGNIQL